MRISDWSSDVCSSDLVTAERFRNGWYYTGDRGRRDANGYLWFEGRDDDVITSSAYRIGPFEVESAFIEHPAVVDAAVVGRPYPQRDRKSSERGTIVSVSVDLGWRRVIKNKQL